MRRMIQLQAVAVDCEIAARVAQSPRPAA
jgi:hypothetical protein